MEEDGKAVVFSDVQYFTNLSTAIGLSVVIVASYVVIYWAFGKQRRQTREELEGRNEEGLLNNYRRHVDDLRKNLLISIFLIVVSHTVLILPIVIYDTYFSVEDPDGGFSLGVVICKIIYEINFSVNFLIYAVLMKHYREAFLDILKIIFPCCFKRQISNSDTEVAVGANSGGCRCSPCRGCNGNCCN